ncbi:hypothetical protein [Nocardioides mangrovicus]|nr:hypothetical protein [Nocardioides mangrovicus]
MRLSLVLSAAALVLVAGCGSSGASAEKSASASPSSTPSASVTPRYPTEWMLDATTRWRLRDSGKYGAFKAVTKNGRRWTGDPRLYEKACGASFLVDGDTPNLEKPVSGTSGRSYYAWLQSDPGRWSAFNAWLQDPAVVYSLSDGLTAPLNTYVGTDKDCKDPSGGYAS